PECSRGPQLLARDDIGDERLEGGVGENRRTAERKGEGKQQRCCHLPQERQNRQRNRNQAETNLHDQKQTATVEKIGEHSAHQAKESVGQRIGHLHQSDEDRGVRGVDQEPLRANGLHPVADVADKKGDPEGAEHGETQRRPTAYGLSGISPLRSSPPPSPSRYCFSRRRSCNFAGHQERSWAPASICGLLAAATFSRTLENRFHPRRGRTPLRAEL